VVPVANHDNAVGGFDRNSLDSSTAWMMNEVGADSQARSVHDSLRTSEGEVLQQWLDGLGVSSTADLNALVRTAHLIRNALRPEQVGDQHGQP
jgi:hypothetical protein